MTESYQPLDLKEHPEVCDCEFTPYNDEPEEESWHYLRQCSDCKTQWYSLHCPHDLVQWPCPGCGHRNHIPED